MLEKFVFRSKARGETGGQQVGFRKRKTLSTRRRGMAFCEIKRAKIIKVGEEGGREGGTVKGRLITPGHVLIITRGFARSLIRRDGACNEPRLMLTCGFQFRSIRRSQ